MTTPDDPFQSTVNAALAAQAAAQTLENQLVAANAQVTTDATTIAGLLAAHTADQATIAQLQAELSAEDPGPIFGANLGAYTVAQRIGQLGKLPMVKLFTLADVAGTIPSKRAVVCWKPDQGQLASGALDTQIINYITAQLAAGVQKLWICNWQEPNGELGDGTLNLATYQAATVHLGQLVQAHGVRGVTRVAQVFTAPQSRTGVSVPDNWIIPAAQLGGADWSVLCYDSYDNPAGAAKFGGDPYATPYPTAASVCDEMLAQVARTGYGPNWMVTELNCPWRKDVAGGDANHALRVATLDAHVQYLLTQQVVPVPLAFLLWEGMGTKFDQTFTVPVEWSWWANYVAQSA